MAVIIQLITIDKIKVITFTAVKNALLRTLTTQLTRVVRILVARETAQERLSAKEFITMMTSLS